MPKVKIKLVIKNEGPVDRAVVLVNDVVVPFTGASDVNIFVRSEVSNNVMIFCYGGYNPGGTSGKSTLSITRAEGKVIEPLIAEVMSNDGVGFALDKFTVKS